MCVIPGSSDRQGDTSPVPSIQVNKHNLVQAVSSGLQNISSKTPRDPAAAAMVADAVRIIDNYIKVRPNQHQALSHEVYGMLLPTVLCLMDDVIAIQGHGIALCIDTLGAAV